MEERLSNKKTKMDYSEEIILDILFMDLLVRNNIVIMKFIFNKI